MDEENYCKFCDVKLTDENWSIELKEKGIKICKLCQMKEAWKNGSLESFDKFLSRNLDLLEKLGFNKNYILMHFFAYGNTYDKKHNNYYIWTYKATKGILNGAILELWFDTKKYQKYASLFLPNNNNYRRISLKRLEEILKKIVEKNEVFHYT